VQIDDNDDDDDDDVWQFYRKQAKGMKNLNLKASLELLPLRAREAVFLPNLNDAMASHLNRIESFDAKTRMTMTSFS
jgi:hypothetical protein